MSAHPQMRDRARRLRRDATVHERQLWALLSLLNRQKAAHFRRQAPIGPFIVDFADLARRLVIELDCGQHGLDQHQALDASRDEWLQKQGFRVLRFWNNDIGQTPEAVFEIIANAVGLNAPHPLPPHKGEGSANPENADTGTPPDRLIASLPLVGRERVGGCGEETCGDPD